MPNGVRGLNGIFNGLASFFYIRGEIILWREFVSGWFKRRGREGYGGWVSRWKSWELDWCGKNVGFKVMFSFFSCALSGYGVNESSNLSVSALCLSDLFLFS